MSKLEGEKKEEGGLSQGRARRFGQIRSFPNNQGQPAHHAKMEKSKTNVNPQRKVHLIRGLEESDCKALDRRDVSKPAVSRGVVKVPSLLFDIELEDTLSEELLDEEVEDTVSEIHSLTKPRSHLEKQLAERVHQIQREVAAEGTKLEATYLARRIQCPGYVFKIRTALGGSCAGSCLRQLRHFFLTCSSSEAPDTVCCVIDPLFKEQFEIANPSKRYAKLLSELPAEVVLVEERLANLVNLLSNEMKASFQATGTTLPPWRHSSSMMSKWKPRRSEDTLVHPTSPTPSQISQHRRSTETKAGKLTVPRLEAFSMVHKRSNSQEGEQKNQSLRPSARGVFVSSPPLENTLASSTKRNRDMGPPTSAYASLLATKLRGVTSYEIMCPNRGQA